MCDWTRHSHGRNIACFPPSVSGRPGIFISRLTQIFFQRVRMDVIACVGNAMYASDMKTSLPKGMNACLKRQPHFIDAHDIGDGFRLRDTDQQMHMVGHDDECVQEEWPLFLNPIDVSCGFLGKCRRCKKRTSAAGDARHQHGLFILNEMALGHDVIISSETVFQQIGTVRWKYANGGFMHWHGKAVGSMEQWNATAARRRRAADCRPHFRGFFIAQTPV